MSNTLLVEVMVHIPLMWGIWPKNGVNRCADAMYMRCLIRRCKCAGAE